MARSATSSPGILITLNFGFGIAHYFLDCDLLCSTIEHTHRHITRNRPAHSSVIVVSVLTRIIHEHFCYNCRSAATTSLRPAGSPLGPSPYCTSTHRVLAAPRAGLATRLSDFAMNLHESSSQAVQKARPARPQQAQRRGVRFGTLSL